VQHALGLRAVLTRRRVYSVGDVNYLSSNTERGVTTVYGNFHARGRLMPEPLHAA
jgi:hypothetical protein